MSVQLRKKKIAGKKESLYLDIYHNGQRQYEFLKIYLEANKKQQNKEMLQLAQAIRAKRELELKNEEHGFVAAHKNNIDFLLYFEKYIDSYRKANIRMFKACYGHFLKFNESKRLPCSSITEKLSNDFLEYLMDRLNGETPYDYFKIFRKVLNQAVRDKILLKNPALDVVVKKPKQNTLQKAILTFEEIQMLAKARCPNDQIKRAFLFACNTGIRTCDLRILIWENINQTERLVEFTQGKTSLFTKINLNDTAFSLLGIPGKALEPIFLLPSQNYINRALNEWCSNAGIDKHITFHCARHSFATNLLIRKIDIKTVADLLGHSSLKHTEKYVRSLAETRRNAVELLPALEIEMA